MRKWLFLLITLTLACRLFQPGLLGDLATPTPIAPTEGQVFPSATPLAATASPTVPEVTPTLVLPEVRSQARNLDTGFTVRTHPDGALFVGDLVSFEVIALDDVDLSDHQVSVKLDASREDELVQTGFGKFGIGNRSQATFFWAWDTGGLDPGDYNLTFTILPEGTTWTETVVLEPATEIPFPEPGAQWASAETDCCVVRYITGTAVERDLEDLLELADQQAAAVSRQLGAEFEEPIQIVLIPRLMGHGGFAGGEIDISYLDRNYAGSAPAQVLKHEMIHILDGRLGGDLRPNMLTEGIAVYQSEGHFKQEPLIPRAAALLELGWYLPFETLTQDFYLLQHEASYLEAAALVAFMADTWGWEAFDDFYRDIHPHSSDLQAPAIDTALESHFGISLTDLESEFMEVLRDQPPNPEYTEDVRLTVEFYDTVRRYQQELDPSAYFLTAWLPDGNAMRERGIVADFLRHPAEPENIALETLLVEADAELRAGSYGQVSTYLKAVNAVLDEYASGSPQPFYVHPLATDYLAIVEASLERGYTPQRIRIDGVLARVWASESGTELVEIGVKRETNVWAVQ